MDMKVKDYIQKMTSSYNRIVLYREDGHDLSMKVGEFNKRFGEELVDQTGKFINYPSRLIFCLEHNDLTEWR